MEDYYQTLYSTKSMTYVNDMQCLLSTSGAQDYWGVPVEAWYSLSLSFFFFLFKLLYCRSLLWTLVQLLWSFSQQFSEHFCGFPQGLADIRDICKVVCSIVSCFTQYLIGMLAPVPQLWCQYVLVCEHLIESRAWIYKLLLWLLAVSPVLSLSNHIT